MRTTSRVLHIEVNVYIDKVKLNVYTRYFEKVGFQLLFEYVIAFFHFCVQW